MPQGVIVDFGGDIGQVEFPDGMSEADIQAASRKIADPRIGKGPGEPAHVGGFLPDRETARKTLPAILGAAAGMATGGAALPLWAAAAIPAVAAASGSVAGDVAYGEPIDAKKAAVEGAWQAGPSLAGAAIRGLKGPMQKLGVKGWQYAAGTGSQKAAREVLETGHGGLRPGNLARMETPRSVTGAFVPRSVSKPGLEAMRSGIERAGQSAPVTITDVLASGGAGYLLGGPKAAAALALARTASKPLPASYLAQGAYSMGGRAASAGTSLANAARSAIIAKLLAEQPGTNPK